MRQNYHHPSHRGRFWSPAVTRDMAVIVDFLRTVGFYSMCADKGLKPPPAVLFLHGDAEDEIPIGSVRAMEAAVRWLKEHLR